MVDRVVSDGTPIERLIPMKRHKMNGSKSKRVFRHTADSTHRFNLPRRAPMRGGIRL